MKKCEECYFFGKAADAPETVEEECMWIPNGENGWELPCNEKEDENGTDD